MWDEQQRSEAASFLGAQYAEAESFIALARGMAEGREAADPGVLVRAYIQGACSYFDHLHFLSRDLINHVARQTGILDEAGSLFDESRGIAPEVVAALCPDMTPSLYTPRSNAALEVIPLLEPGPNELADSRLPPPMNMLLHLPRRPPMQAYVTDDASVYAHPFRYQVLSKDRTGMWMTGSPRGLSRDAIGATELIGTDRDIVVLQDRFNFANIAHFLCDGISRALLLEQALGSLRASLLVFGGIPGEYHAAVCQALCNMLDLSADNILFPDHAVTLETSGRCVWFSDQVEGYVHPAQMAHPTSIALLRSLIEGMPGDPSDLRRIYIARPETGHMRVANEAALTAALEARGFAAVPVELLSVRQKIGLFRGAEMIVAPHGAELTHLIAGDRLRGVIELFPPGAGNDANAFIARAGKIRYAAAVGAGDAAAYDAPIEQICREVEIGGNRAAGVSWRKPANLLAGSRSFAGFRPEDEAIEPPPEAAELAWGNVVFGHQAGFSDQAPPTLGRWPGIDVIPGLRYTASCWVWIPEQFAGNQVIIALTDAAVAELTAADLTRRALWQRVYVSATPLTERCDVELRAFSVAPARFATTCWQLERGGVPTAYVETP